MLEFAWCGLLVVCRILVFCVFSGFLVFDDFGFLVMFTLGGDFWFDFGVGLSFDCSCVGFVLV